MNSDPKNVLIKHEKYLRNICLFITNKFRDIFAIISFYFYDLFSGDILNVLMSLVNFFSEIYSRYIYLVNCRNNKNLKYQ